jgi:hypothetical protein
MSTQVLHGRVDVCVRSAARPLLCVLSALNCNSTVLNDRALRASSVPSDHVMSKVAAGSENGCGNDPNGGTKRPLALANYFVLGKAGFCLYVLHFSPASLSHFPGLISPPTSEWLGVRPACQ